MSIIENSIQYPYKHPSFHRVLEITNDPQAVTEDTDWSIRHMGLDKISFKGKGQRVGVLDTGADVYHQDLEGQVTACNFITGNKQTPPWRDDCGHGTFCVGEIVAKANGMGVIGVAPQATAFAGRVLYGNDNDQWRSDVDGDIANGILGCIKEGCHVISMSLGGPGASVVLSDALAKAVDAGIIPVAAAGNEKLEGSPYASYPANYPCVVSVAAANKEDLPAWFSTMGSPDAPGKPEIAVASLEFYWGCLPGRSTYGRMIGTSQATPTIAGVALLWREARQQLAAAGKKDFPKGADVLKEFRQWLHRVAKDTNNNGWDPELGYGVLLLDPTDFNDV